MVDFYADWCENCRVMAPRLVAVALRYAERVNFVTLNGDTPDRQNDSISTLFGVEGIPHFAFVSGGGDVETALVGLVPTSVFVAQLDALLAGGPKLTAPLPYLGFDAFASSNVKQSHHTGRGISAFEGGRNLRVAVEVHVER